MTNKNANFKQYVPRGMDNEQLCQLRELMKLAAADAVDAELEELDLASDEGLPAIDQAAYDKIVEQVYESVYEPFSTESYEDMADTMSYNVKCCLDELK